MAFSKNYRSNIGKSIMFSMKSALENRNPAIHGFYNANEEFFTNIRDTLRDLRKGQARLDKVFNLDEDDRQLLDLVKNAPSKVKEQFFTGNWQMSEAEENKLMGFDDMDDMGMDMSDFNLDDDEVGTDETMDDLKDLLGDIKSDTDGVTPLEKTTATIGEAQIASTRDTTKAVIKTGEVTANAISVLDRHTQETQHVVTNGIASSNKLQASIAVSRAKLEQTLHNKTMQGITTINENLANMVEFNNNVISKYTEQATQYYTDSLEELRKISSVLERAYPEKQKVEERESEYSRLGLDSNSVLNLSGYMQTLKANFENTAVGSAVSTIVNPQVLGQVLANPLGVILETVVDSMVPKALDVAMQELNKTIVDFVPALLGKAARVGETSNNMVIQFLGELFGINPGRTEKDIAKYEKGAVPFDGITHRTINVVIPTYLSQIVAALTGKDIQMYDHRTAKFKNYRTMKDEVEAQRTQDARSAMGYDLFDDISNALDEKDFGKNKNRAEEKKKYQDQIGYIVKALATSGKNNIKIHDYNEMNMLMDNLGKNEVVDPEVLRWFVNELKGTKDEVTGRRKSSISNRAQMRLSAIAHHYSDTRERRFRYKDPADYMYDLVEQGLGTEYRKPFVPSWNKEDWDDEDEQERKATGIAGAISLFADVVSGEQQKRIKKRKEKERKAAEREKNTGRVATDNDDGATPLGLGSLFGGSVDQLTSIDDTIKLIHKDTLDLANALVRGGRASGPPIPPQNNGPNGPGGNPPAGGTNGGPNPPPANRIALGRGHALNDFGYWVQRNNVTDDQFSKLGAGIYLDEKGNWVYRESKGGKAKILVNSKKARMMSEEQLLQSMYGNLLHKKGANSKIVKRISDIAGYSQEQIDAEVAKVKQHKKDKEAKDKALADAKAYKEWKKEHDKKEEKNDPERLEEERQEQETFLSRLARIMKSPAEALASALDSVNEGMYRLLFGDAEADDMSRPRGMIQVIRDTLKEGFKDVVDTIAKEFWHPLKRMIFTDFQNGGLYKSLKNSWNSFTESLPWNQQRDEEDEGRESKESKATAGSGGAGFLLAPHYARGRKKRKKPTLQSTGGRILYNGKWVNANKLTEEQRKAATTGFYRDANGQMVVMHSGETEIVPAHTGEAGQKIDAKDENQMVIDVYSKAIQMGNNKMANEIIKLTELTKEQLDAQIQIKEATTKTAEETEKANKANAVEKKQNEGNKASEKNKGISDFIKETLSDVSRNVASHLIGGETDKNGKLKPVSEQIGDMFAKGAQTLSKYFFGAKPDPNQAMDDYKASFKKAVPRGIGRGIVYGGGLGLASMATGLGGAHGFGLLGSLFLPGGPIGSMIVGLGAGLALENKQFREWLFGKETVDENGNGTGKYEGGKISGIANFFERNKKAILGGGALGLLQGLTGHSIIGGLLSAIPGGSALGFLPALGIGIMGPVTVSIGAALALNSETFKTAMFGKLDPKSQKRTGNIISRKTMDEFKKHVPQIATGAALGAGASLVLGNMGILGSLMIGPYAAAILGGAAGFAITSDRFKEALFGKQDKDGKFIKGGLADVLKNFIMTEVGTPLKLFFKKELVETKGWFKKKILNPLAFAFPIYKRALGKAFNKATEGIQNVIKTIGKRIEKALGPIGTWIHKFFVGFFDSMRKTLGGTIHSIMEIGRNLISSPVKLLTMPAEYIASGWRRGSEEDKEFMKNLDAEDVERQAKANINYKHEKSRLDLQNKVHDIRRKNMRGTGYAATKAQLMAKTQAWREEQARKEMEEQQKQRELLEREKELMEKSNEHLKNIEDSTKAMANPGSTVGNILGTPSASTANSVQTDTVSQNGNLPTTSKNLPSTLKKVTSKAFKRYESLFNAKRVSKTAEDSGGGAEANRDFHGYQMTEAQANAIQAITQVADKVEETANRVEDKDRVDRNSNEIRAEGIIAARKEEVYRERIIKALSTLRQGGEKAIKKSKDFLETLLDFLKGMAAFGGVMALLKLIKDLLGGGQDHTVHDERAVRDLAGIVGRKAARSSLAKMAEDAARKKAMVRAAEREMLEKAEKDAAQAAERKGLKDRLKGLYESGKNRLRNARDFVTGIPTRIGDTITGYKNAGKDILKSIGEDIKMGYRYGANWRTIAAMDPGQIETWEMYRKQFEGKDIFEKASDKADSIKKRLSEIGKSGKLIKDNVKSVVGAFKENAPKVVGNWISNIKVPFMNDIIPGSTIGNVIDWGKQLPKDAVNAFKETGAGSKVTKLASDAVEYGKGLKQAAGELPGMAKQGVENIGKDLYQGIKKVGNSIDEKFGLSEIKKSTQEVVVDPLKNLAQSAKNRAVGGFEWFVEKCKGAIGAIVNNPSVQKILGTNSSKLGEKLMGAISKLNPKNFLGISGKVAAATGKSSLTIGTAGLAQLAFSVYDAYSGANDAGELWGVANEDVTPGMRTAAVLLNVIMGLGPMVWVDLALEAVYLGSSMLNPTDPINIKRYLLKFIYECLPDVTEEDLKAIDEKQSKIDKEYEEYVKQEYIKFGGKSEEEFNAMSEEEQQQYIETQKKAMEEQGKSVQSKDAFLHNKNKDDNFVLSTLRETAIGKFLTGYNDEKGNYVPGLFSKLNTWFFGEDVFDDNGQYQGKAGGAWTKIKETAIWLGDKIYTVVKGVAKFVDGMWDFVLNKSFDEKLEFLWKKVFFGGYNDEGKYEKAFIPDMIDKICNFVTGIGDAVVKTGEEVWRLVSAGDLKGIAKMVLGFFGWKEDPEGEAENAGLVSTLVQKTGDFLNGIVKGIEDTVTWWNVFWDKFSKAPFFSDPGKNNSKWDMFKQLFLGFNPGEGFLEGCWRRIKETVNSFADAVTSKFKEVKKWWDSFKLKDVIKDGLKKYLPKFAQAIEDTDKHERSSKVTPDYAPDEGLPTGGTGGGGALLPMPKGGFTQKGNGVSNNRLLDGSSMREMGCGPTGVATALNAVGIHTDPNHTASTLSSSDFAGNGSGVLPSGIARMVNSAGGSFTPIDPSDKRSIAAAQASGLPIITGGSKADGISTRAGHYNVVVGNKTHDPLGRSSKTVSADDISRTATSHDGKLGMVGVVSGGGGNKLFMDAQSGPTCTLHSTSALVNAYTGSNTTADSYGFGNWYSNVLSMPADELGFSKDERSGFESAVEKHFSAHPENPVYLYQTGGDGNHGGHEPHPINRVSGNHATIIGRKLSSGDYEIYDSNGGVIHTLPLNAIFDDTAEGSSKNNTTYNESNLLLIPKNPPSQPITEWGASKGASSGTSSKGSSTPASDGKSGKKNPSTLPEFFQEFAKITQDFGMSLLSGKVYTGESDSDSGSSSAPGSSGVTITGKPVFNYDVSKLPKGDLAMAVSANTGLPADLVLAQWGQEAGRDMSSTLAVNYHNYGGMKCPDNAPGEHKSTNGKWIWNLTGGDSRGHSYFKTDQDFVNYASHYYPLYKDQGILEAKTPREWVHALKKGGYMTADESMYASNVESIWNSNKQDAGGGGGLFRPTNEILSWNAYGGGGDINSASAPLVDNGTTRASTAGIVFHHMGHVENGIPVDVDWDAAKVNEMHKKKGWDGIGYHYVIRKDGKIEAGRALNNIGAHAKHEAGMPSELGNSNAIGINLSGTFMGQYAPTQEQLDSAAQLSADLAAKYNFPLDDKHLIGHRDTTNTECPGDNLYNNIPNIIEAAKNKSPVKATAPGKPAPGATSKGGSKGYASYFSKLKTILSEYTQALLAGKPYTGGADLGSDASGSTGDAQITGQNAPDIWNYFKSNGYSDAETAGIMGNFMVESGLDPQRVQGSGHQTAPEITVDGTTGYGLAQWTSADRQQGLKDYAQGKGLSSGSLAAQLEWANIEAGKSGVPGIMHAGEQTPEAQAKIWQDKYERPGTPKTDKRISAANDFFNQFASKAGGGGDGNGAGNIFGNLLGGLWNNYLQRKKEKKLKKQQEAAAKAEAAITSTAPTLTAAEIAKKYNLGQDAFDGVGNIKDFEIDDMNRITEDDDLVVRYSKQRKQLEKYMAMRENQLKAQPANNGFKTATLPTTAKTDNQVTVTPKSTYIQSATDRSTKALADSGNSDLVNAIKQLDIHAEMRELIDLMRTNTNNQTIMNNNLKKATQQMAGSNASHGSGTGANNATNAANEMKGAKMPEGKPGGPNADMKRGQSDTNSYSKIHQKNLEIAKGGSFSTFSSK